MRAIIYVASLVMLSVAFSGCDDKENSPKNPEPGQVAITHVESLFDSLTNWGNIEKDKLHVIRSGEELKSYIKDCETELPTVDFEKHSLLVVTGNASHGIVNMESELNRGDTNTYSFDVNIELDLTSEYSTWKVMVLAPAVSRQADISLDATLIG